MAMRRFELQLEEDLYERIAAIAKLNDRSVSAEVRLALRNRTRPLEDQPISDAQRGAFFGKCNDLDKLQSLAKGTAKARVLEKAGEEFGRTVTSPTELHRGEMSWVLD